MKLGLVLEGGGMRGIYTAGVLDYLMEQKIWADYVIGVSAGACHAASYLSKQPGRSLLINTKYAGNKDYMSFRNFFREGSVFGMDFVFHRVPDELEPYDYDTMLQSPTEFVVVTTDIHSGKPAYFDKSHLQHNSYIIGASCAIPVFSRIVPYQGGEYLDGGTSDPIPVRKAIEDGCDHVIVVLTREHGYVKSPEKFRHVYHRKYRKYPNMVHTMDERHNIYNDTLSYLAELQRQGTATVIAPKDPPAIGRFEKNADNLRALYQTGYDDTKQILQESKLPFLNEEVTK